MIMFCVERSNLVEFLNNHDPIYLEYLKSDNRTVITPAFVTEMEDRQPGAPNEGGIVVNDAVIEDQGALTAYSDGVEQVVDASNCVHINSSTVFISSCMLSDFELQVLEDVMGIGIKHHWTNDSVTDLLTAATQWQALSSSAKHELGSALHDAKNRLMKQYRPCWVEYEVCSNAECNAIKRCFPFK